MPQVLVSITGRARFCAAWAAILPIEAVVAPASAHVVSEESGVQEGQACFEVGELRSQPGAEVDHGAGGAFGVVQFHGNTVDGPGEAMVKPARRSAAALGYSTHSAMKMLVSPLVRLKRLLANTR